MSNNNPNLPNINGLSVEDRKGVVVSTQDYERMKREAINRFGVGDIPGQMTFGQRFEQALNSKFTDEVIGKMIGGVFGGSPSSTPAKPHSGVVGAIYDVLNTKFAAEIGAGIGQNITGVIKELGSERVGRVIDSYTGRPSVDGQPSSQQQSAGAEQQISPEEQQKRSESALMALDSTNIEHLNAFMQATKITNVSVAQKALLAEQNRILQSRGLSTENERPNKHITPQERSPGRHPERQSEDLNRRLMQEYENPGGSRSSNQYPEERGASDFFSNSPQSNMGVDSNRSPDEIILSLNPDDPISIHQYMALKGIAGVEQPDVRKMLIKEQEKLRKNTTNNINNVSVQELNQPTQSSPPVSPITPVQDTHIDSSWSDHDGPRVIKKEEFYQEIGLKKELKNEQENAHQSSVQQSESLQPDSSPKGDINNIVSLIEGLGNNFESSIKSVSDNIKILNDKIETLENEIVTLKSKVPEDIVYADIPHDAITNDSIIARENISDVIESRNSPKMISLNDITKPLKDVREEDSTKMSGDISDVSLSNPIDVMNDILLKDLNKTEDNQLENTEDIKDDISTSVNNNNESESENSNNEREISKDSNEKERRINVINEFESRPKTRKVIKRKSQPEHSEELNQVKGD